MTYLYIVVVAAAMALHFAFLGYLVAGGFLAMRWPRTIGLHVLVVVWGVGSVTLNFPCPLTTLERWAREHAGMAPLPSTGFIDHYITGEWYPEQVAGVVESLAFTVVLVSWALFAYTVARRRGSSLRL